MILLKNRENNGLSLSSQKKKKRFEKLNIEHKSKGKACMCLLIRFFVCVDALLEGGRWFHISVEEDSPN